MSGAPTLEGSLSLGSVGSLGVPMSGPVSFSGGTADGSVGPLPVRQRALSEPASAVPESTTATAGEQCLGVASKGEGGTSKMLVASLAVPMLAPVAWGVDADGSVGPLPARQRALSEPASAVPESTTAVTGERTGGGFGGWGE